MNFILVGLLVSVGVGLQAAAANAQIVLDGSLGPRGALRGPNFTIGSELGTIRGRNLFHSFEQFNIPTGESATFNGPGWIANILSRVTGGQPSYIDGRLASSIPGANLFLLNPSGVLFGAHATLDVKGSFHASTADYLRFADGQRFYATLSHESALTAAAPAAFGFLGPSTAPIAIGNAQDGAPMLRVPEGQVLSFVGGAVSVGGIQGQTLALGGGDIEITGAAVTAPGGEIRLVAGAGASLGEAGLAAPNGLLQLRSFTTSGEVTLRPAAANPTGRIDMAAGTSIDVSGDSGGTVAIRGGHLFIDNSTIRANTSGAAPGAPRAIDIQIADDVTLTHGASIQSAAVSPSADAGDLTIDARSLSLTGGARIASGDFLDASQFMFSHGGNVWINATDGITIAGSGSVVSSMTRSVATGGRLTITDHAGSLTLTDHGAIRTTTRAPATGSGGDITIDVGRLFLNSSGQMSTEVQNPLGRSGRIAINAADSIAISGPMTSVFSTGANGGGMTVSAPFITLEDHAALETRSSNALAAIVIQHVGNLSVTGGAEIRTNAAGNSGAVVVRDVGSVFLSGAGSGIVTDAGLHAGDISLDIRGTLTLTNRAMIQSGSNTGGASSGNVTVAAHDVLIADRATVSSQTVRGGLGEVSITARTLRMDNGFITANTEDAGHAGTVAITVDQLSLTHGGRIVTDNTRTGATGSGGNVFITAYDSVSLSGGAGIDSETAGRGHGGNIEIHARRVQLADHATISARSSGQGDAGNVTLAARDSVTLRTSAVTTEATTAKGGNIEITGGSLVYLLNSQISTSVGSGNGRGGDIRIDPQFVVLDHSQVRANAVGGPGGNINIVSDFFLQNRSSITASSEKNVPGTISIQSRFTELSSSVVPLPAGLAQAVTLLRASCAARIAAGKASSLAVTGRQGVPLEPGGYLPSPLMAPELGGGEPSGSDADPVESVPRLSLSVFAPACSR